MILRGKEMGVYYRGAGVGTWWHGNDARLSGFSAHQVAQPHTIARVMHHVGRMTVTSPYISLTRSYAVAEAYALNFGKKPATRALPAYVYELEITDADGVTLIDPLCAVAGSVDPLASPSYHHDGDPQFLLGVVSPTVMAWALRQQVKSPGYGGHTARSPNLTIELEAMCRALRDAEVLALQAVPAGCLRGRHDVY